MQRRIFSLFWRESLHYKGRALAAIVTIIITSALVGYIGPLIVSKILAQLQAGTLSFESSRWLLLMYIGVQLFGEVGGWRLAIFFTWTMEIGVMRRLNNKIFWKLENHGLDFHANRFSGSLVSQAGKLIGAYERFINGFFYGLLPVTVGVTTAVIILSFVFWQYAVILGVLSLTFAGLIIATSGRMAEVNKKESKAHSLLSGRLADMLSNILTVKSHGAENSELLAQKLLSDSWHDASKKVMKTFMILSASYASVMATMNIAAFVAAIWASEYLSLPLATIYLCITYTLALSSKLWEMNNIMRTYHRIIGDAHEMVEVLGLDESIKDTSTSKLSVEKGAISMKDVSFTYEGKRGATLFHNFSLTIPAGQKVGLVGHSGSGKTTLTKLLLRFSDLDSGAIKVDNQDISEVTQASLRENIAYVPQEPLLFHRSLRENIAYGKPDATDDEVIEAAKKANAAEFIDKLTDGYDTLVGERGVKLSGGQRQRIVIARAILKNAPILVLDEATSALDSESEKLIQASLGNLMEGRTSIVIAHRLSTISKLDRILVLDNGTIVEDGSHKELLERGGVYARLWSHQTGGFIEN